MFHVTIYQNDKNECTGFQTEGHAGYAEAGKDIVCAAASVLIINTINAIELYTDDKVSVMSEPEDGIITCHLAEPVSGEGKLLLKTMILGLSEMAHDENYEQYIDLSFEEVLQP